MARIKVLETKEFKFEGERFSIPAKVEIKGCVYNTEMDAYFRIGELHKLDIEELEDLTLWRNTSILKTTL